MLLIRRFRLARRDEGAALVTVIAISMIVAIVSATMVATVSFATSTSADTRAAVQAQASAEDALDSTLAQMSTFTKGSETTFPCSLSYVDVTTSGQAATTVSMSYRVEGASTFSCPVATSQEVVEAEVVAATTVTLATGDGQRTASRTVKQRLSAESSSTTSSLFDYGVFSNANLKVTNSFTVTGGGVHTNGSYECSRLGTVVGSVTAVGDVTLSNSCYTEDIAAGGTFTCNSDGQVAGSVTAAGTGTTSLTNTCKISGSLTAAGPISVTTTTPRVGGNLVSSGSSITVTNPAPIVSGYGMAGTSVSVTGGAISTVFAGGATANSPSASPTVPETETMPSITWADLTPTGTNVLSWKTFLSQNAIANGAPSYSATRSGSTCSAERGSYSLNGDLVGPSVATVLDARGCTVNLQGDGSPLTITLQADMTIVADSFTTSNGVRIKSTKSGSDAKLRIIVPITAGVATCSSIAATGGISFTGTVTIDSNVDTLLYTNGTVQLTNDTTINGSVYGCTTNLSVNTSITYADMTPPGMEVEDGGVYSFEETARYNLTAGSS